ncbi:MAG: hypothetical protein E6K13_06370 [Methanobacteriota archaeon]|nr:MAG: hypothetical protein E6K13_06370 [Euryarchaeota archaeon]
MGNGPPARLWRSLAILVAVAGLVAPGGHAAAGGPVEHPLAAPLVASTSPAAGATGVQLSSAIQVRFSEAMNASTVSPVIMPNVAITTFWPTPDVLVLTPVPPGLANCTVYSVRVSGRDLDEGLALSPGAAPNPWSFMTVCDRPFLTQTIPADGAQNVLAAAPIVVTYSEPMDVLAPSFNLMPTPSSMLTSWDASRTVLTVRTSLQPGMTYTATASGRDDDGNALVTSPIPNPWTFRVNEPPTISGLNVSRSGCLESGSNVTIDWSMVDDSDAATDLEVLISYWDAGVWRPVLGPARNLSSPASFQWTLPTADVDTRVRLQVNDTVGASSTAEVSGIRIDSAPPRVLATTPANNTPDIPLDSSIVIVFSEPMNQTATQAALSIAPQLAGATYRWANGDSALTIDPVALVDRTQYRVTVAGTARDTCGTGRPMATPANFTFTTEKVPSLPPVNLAATSTGESWVELAWDPVAIFITGTPIPSGSNISYRVLRSETETGPGALVGETTVARFRDEGLRPSTTYTYRVLAVVDGKSSDVIVLSVRTHDPFVATPAGWGTIALIAAVGGGSVVFLLRRRWMARRRMEKERSLAEEIQDIGRGVLGSVGEPDTDARRRLQEDLRARFQEVLRPAGKGETRMGSPGAVYEMLAGSLTEGSAADRSRGDDLLRRQLGPLADQLQKFPTAYDPIRNAEGAQQRLTNLPDFARRAVLLEYVRGLEEYLRARIEALVRAPGGPAPRPSRAAGPRISISNLLNRVDQDPTSFVSRSAAWTESRPVLLEALDLRGIIEDLNTALPTPGRIRAAVFLALISCRGLFRRTMDRGAVRGT